jgi:tetratricopeptide (TPR) repeat protein
MYSKVSMIFGWIYLLTLSLVPIISVTDTNELYEFPKTYLFYTLALFCFSLYLTFEKLKIKEGNIPRGKNARQDAREVKPTTKNLRTALDNLGSLRNLGKVTPLSAVIILYALFFLFSTAFSNHIYTSVWGYYTRFNGGLVSLVALLGFFFVGKRILNTADLNKVLKLQVFPLGVVSLVSIYQHLFLDIPRSYTTFGQPNWSAQYLSMLIILSIYYFAKEKKFYWYCIFVLGYTGLWFTYSMSGLLALVLGGGVAYSIFYIKGMYKSVGMLVKEVIGFLTTIMLISLLTPGIFFARVDDVFNDLKLFLPIKQSSFAPVSAEKESDAQETPQETQTTQKEILVPTNRNVSDPGFIRKGMWQGSLKLAFSSPKVFLIGTGPETFPYEFQAFRPPELNYSSEWEYVLNKPHNFYLELLTEQGIIGLVLYLTLGILAIKALWKTQYYLIPMILSFYISNFFGWPVISTDILFWFILIFAVHKQGEFKESPKSNTLSIKSWSNLVLIFVIWGVFIVLLSQLRKTYKADVYFEKSQTFLEQSDIEEAELNIKKALELNPKEPNYWRGSAKIKIYMLSYYTAFENPDEEKSMQLRNSAYNDLNTAQELNPKNLVTLRNSVPLMFYISLKQPAEQPSEENIESSYREITKKFYESVKRKYSTDAGVIALIASYEKRLGLNKEYEESKERAKYLRPDIIEWHKSFIQ